MLLSEDRNEVLVVGLGATGQSLVRYLSTRGIPLQVADSRENPPGLDWLRATYPAIRCHLGSAPIEQPERIGTILLSPGLSPQHPLVQSVADQGAAVLNDISLFAREAQAPIIGITGSNGKSTVTSMVGAIAEQAGLRVRVGGNLGQPALDLLGDDVDLYIIELSSFQLQSCGSLPLRAGALLNLSPDHLDWHGSYAAYQQAKAQIFAAADHALCNRDDADALALVGHHPRPLTFGLGRPQGDDWGIDTREGIAGLCQGNTWLMNAAELPLAGAHNLANALAAAALARLVGIERQAVIDGLKHFSGLPHRTQRVRVLDGVIWYNDSKGTNIGATSAALHGLSTSHQGRAVLIAGGLGKGADFSELAPAVKQHCRALVLIGEDAPKIDRAMPATIQRVHARNMADAVQRGRSLAMPGDYVLLSPACASFDMYANYQERGKHFEALVAELQP